MTLTKLSPREQIISAVVLFIFVLTAYSLFRFIPENDEIKQLNSKIQKTERKLLRTEVPDEPTDDLNSLQEKLDDQQSAMALIKQEAELIEQSLAAFDSQEIRVRISQLARQSNLRIRVNEVLKNPVQNYLVNPTKNKKKKNRAVAQPLKNKILPESYSWMARMSEGTIFHRPMQRMELIGDYQSVQRFIYGLENLPWQATIIRINISKMPTESPYGFTQQLSTELVIAL